MGDLPGHEFRGNQWTHGAGEERGIVTESFEHGYGSEGRDRARQAAKEAHRALKAAGFKPEGQVEKKKSESYKLGKSAAYGRSADVRTTRYVHETNPEKKATLELSLHKYRENTVTISHELIKPPQPYRDRMAKINERRALRGKSSLKGTHKAFTGYTGPEWEAKFGGKK